jgi:excisionase family DNA binding protein
MPVSQAARLLAVHVSTIRRWIGQGKLPAYRVGDKGVRVRYSDVMQLLTPLSIGEEDGGHAGDRSPGHGHLTQEEQRSAQAAVASAR